MSTQSNIIKHSLNIYGSELITFELTFPRIILPEMLTHRMFSRNTSSSRAIPLKKMLEIVKNNPFIPIAWQKNHSGMQGTEYFTKEEVEYNNLVENWLLSRDQAVTTAETLGISSNVTKQLCNRLLEPFMWTKMLVTTSKEGLENFFELRCPSYQFHENEPSFKSKKEFCDYYIIRGDKPLRKSFEDYSFYDWQEINSSQAEIHIQQLAELMYDAYNDSEPQLLYNGEFHLPFIEIEEDLEITK